MFKNFDSWNKIKKVTNDQEKYLAFYEREIWWAKVGINVGVEIDGKGDYSLRPVIILKKFNHAMALIVPTTAQDKKNKHYLDVLSVDGRMFRACLSHIKTIDTKRLLRKTGVLQESDHTILLRNIINLLEMSINTKPLNKEGNLGGRSQ